jgi:hypothetical protein
MYFSYKNIIKAILQFLIKPNGRQVCPKLLILTHSPQAGLPAIEILLSK